MHFLFYISNNSYQTFKPDQPRPAVTPNFIASDSRTNTGSRFGPRALHQLFLYPLYLTSSSSQLVDFFSIIRLKSCCHVTFHTTGSNFPASAAPVVLGGFFSPRLPTTFGVASSKRPGAGTSYDLSFLSFLQPNPFLSTTSSIRRPFTRTQLVSNTAIITFFSHVLCFA